jgi:hypothetical protein
MGTNPLLANALDLDRWADTLESRGAFPELMRRLLAQTPGVTNIDIRAREGTAAPGWDGTATSDGSSFLPKGELRFEFGTNQQPKSKANEDYNKRADPIVGKSDEIFVFATPRNWAGAAEWAKQRSSENKFASVEAFDAHRIEGWLQSLPAVHYWISEQLGKPVSGAQTLTSWCERLHRNCIIDVPPAFHAAGRSKEAEKLMQRLHDNKIAPVIQAAWRDDALAFCYAVLREKDPTALERTLVVFTPEVWHYLAIQSSSFILIPMFDDPDIGLAQTRGHNLIQIADNSSYVLDNNVSIRLPKISREVAERILHRVALSSFDVAKMAALARRSMSAFYRTISLDQTMKKPDWSTNAETVKVLAPLMLVGAWEYNHPEDCRAIENLAGVSNEKINALLDKLYEKHQSNAPFVRSGDRWSIVDPLGAADLMFHKISEQHVNCWENLVNSVVLSEMRKVAMRRGCASAEQFVQNIGALSATLQRNVMRGLPLVSAWAERNAGPAHPLLLAMKRMINGFFDAGFESEDSIGLIDLSWAFVYFAEALPDLFLDRIDGLVRTVDSQNSLSRAVLCNGENGTFVTDAADALERLTWSRQYCARAIFLIAAIADKTCDEGLCAALSLDLCKTLGVRSKFGNASVDDKGAIVQTLLSKYPKVGWYALTGIMHPKMFNNIMPRRPIYRDWSVENCVSNECVAIYLEKIIDVAVLTAESDVSRWEILLDAVGKYGCDKLQRVVKELRQRVQPSALSKSEAVELSNILQRYVGMSASCAGTEDCARQLLDVELETLIASLESDHDLVKFSRLFVLDRTLLSKFSQPTFEDRSISRESKRLEVLQSVCQRNLSDLRVLAEHVEDLNCIGRTMAHLHRDLDSLVLRWFDEGTVRLSEVAKAYVLEKASNSNVSWVRSVLNSDMLQQVGREHFVAGLPLGIEWAAVLGEIDPLLVRLYWESFDAFEIMDISSDDASESVRQLIALGYADKAIVLLSCEINRGGVPALSDVIDALLLFAEFGVLQRGDPIFASANHLLEWIDCLDVDHPDIYVVEFLYFASLHSEVPFGKLYRYFSSDSQRFVSLVCGSYVPSGCPKWCSEEEIREAQCAILSRWNYLPGLSVDDGLNGSDLKQWFQDCLLLFEQANCLDVGNEGLGRVLASSPEGSDGMWPVEDVRYLIEKFGTAALKNGLIVGHISLYGPTVKGTYEGGNSERELMNRYREYSWKMNARWPKTASILKLLADYYQMQAAVWDRDAEERADQG